MRRDPALRAMGATPAESLNPCSDGMRRDNIRNEKKLKNMENMCLNPCSDGMRRDLFLLYNEKERKAV